MLLRSGLAALLLALTLLLGVLAPVSQAAQTTYPGMNRIFALGNDNLDIDGVDDQRADVNVAVMDIGIDLDDPDLNVVDGLDCTGATPTNYTCESDTPDDGDIDGPPFYGWDHGTYTAKAIGAIDNSIDKVGVAPGARIWSLAVAPENTYEHHKVQTNTTTLNLSATIAALQWVIGTRNDSDPSNDIHVLTAWVGPECPPNPATRPRIICPGGITGAQSLLIESLVTDATNEGVAIVRGSGNWGENMAPFHLYDSSGNKNYIISSSVVDTDGLPGGLGPDGARCGGIFDDGPTNVADDHSNPGTGWGLPVDLAAPGSCSSGSTPWTAGATAVLASQIKPDSRADVDDIRDALVATGNQGWTDDSTDGVREPLVDVSDEGVFDPQVRPGSDVGDETVGMYRSGTWDLRNSNSSGSPNVTFSYYSYSTDAPVVGDWDGDGDDTIGIFRPTDGTWHLRNANSAGSPNASFGYHWGATTDKPIVGDWDGDGDDTVGMYRSGQWDLRNSNSSGPPDASFAYYSYATDIPVVGDWDGDGDDTIGIFRPTDGTWHLRNSNSAGSPDISFGYHWGASTDKPVVGDWDGDGDDTIGMFRAGTGTWELRNANSSGSPDASFGYHWGSSTDKPVVGDWDGS